jgi:uncharacterized protein YjbI with pentapeptide repeats
VSRTTGLSGPSAGGPAEPVLPDVPEDLVPSAPAHLSDAEFDGVLIERLARPGLSAAGAHISESRVVDADLSNASMDRAVLRDVAWSGGDLANARCIDAQIRRAHLEDVRATGLDLTRSKLENVVFEGCRLDLALFRASTMNRVRFEGCRLEDADLFEVAFTDVVFEDCDLRNANWSGVTFKRAEIRGCELAGGVSLERLRGVRMPWDDVIRSAAEIAIAAGIEIVD